jgi:hypothetical protein
MDNAFEGGVPLVPPRHTFRIGCGAKLFGWGWALKKPAKVGTIDMEGLFEAAAQRLLVSIQQGRILWRTKNIRDAGTPFEMEFRAFLKARLPAPFDVTSGYLFDPASNCTPQVDAMVLDGRESHELMRSDEGAAYVPFPSGRTLIEIKNSGAQIAKHLGQVGAIASAVDGMKVRARSLQSSPSGVYLERPLSILVIGDTKDAKLRHFQNAYTSEVRDPGLTLLLDRGLVIARRTYDPNGLITFPGDTDDNKAPILNFYAYKATAGEWALWEPKGYSGSAGRALLWLYFAIVAQLNWSARGNQGAIIDFTTQVARDFPLVLKSDLSTATQW